MKPSSKTFKRYVKNSQRNSGKTKRPIDPSPIIPVHTFMLNCFAGVLFIKLIRIFFVPYKRIVKVLHSIRSKHWRTGSIGSEQTFAQNTRTCVGGEKSDLALSVGGLEGKISTL